MCSIKGHFISGITEASLTGAPSSPSPGWMEDLGSQCSSPSASYRKVTFYSASDNVANNELSVAETKDVGAEGALNSVTAANDQSDLSCHQKWNDSTAK